MSIHYTGCGMNQYFEDFIIKFVNKITDIRSITDIGTINANSVKKIINKKKAQVPQTRVHRPNQQMYSN